MNKPARRLGAFFRPACLPMVVIIGRSRSHRADRCRAYGPCEDATERVNDVQRGIQRAKQMAETARLVANRVSLWLALSLLYRLARQSIGRCEDRRLRNVWTVSAEP